MSRWLTGLCVALLALQAFAGIYDKPDPKHPGGIRGKVAKGSKGYKKWANSHVPANDRLAWSPVRRILEHWMLAHPLSQWPLKVKKDDIECPVIVPFAKDFLFVGLLDCQGTKRIGGG